MMLHPFDIPLIKDQVTRYLTTQDLLSLIQVSHLWSEWFIPSLWHSFRIHYNLRELTVLTTPVKTITVRARKAITVPCFYHRYYQAHRSEEDGDDDTDEELQEQREPLHLVAANTPLARYSQHIHSLVLYRAIPVIFQDPCPYRFENLYRLQFHSSVQDEEIQRIPPFLRAHPTIQDLTLGYMVRDPEQMTALATVLKSLAGLRTLSLTLTQLEGRRCARRLIKALSGLQEARFTVLDFFEDEEKDTAEEEMQFRGWLSSSVPSLRRLYTSVPKDLDAGIVFPFLRRCRHLQRLEIWLRQGSQDEFGTFCNGAVFPRLEHLQLHTDVASDDVITSILADESHREPEGEIGRWRGGGGGEGLRLESLKISSTKREHIYPGSFWALAQYHGQTLTSLELGGIERMAHQDYNVLLSWLVMLRNLKITITLWPPKQNPEPSYRHDSFKAMLYRRMKQDAEWRSSLGPSWECVHLETLHLTLQHVPSNGSSPLAPDRFKHYSVIWMERSYLHIFKQIGKLRELRELVLQGPLNPLRLKVKDPAETGPWVRNEETMCKLLSQLSGLCELRGLDMEQLRGRLIGVEEVVWMLDHWPKLVQLKGLEKLSTKDVVAWLHARRPWIDLGKK
ncbi:hypothetical protein BGZ72_003841 [Mortierella alpina]|nr:hypothetical protein BGZ72_003841 [Mortierella alpina]